MSKASNNSSNGITLLGGLLILFIGLKLGEVGVVAGWSWWWVMSPMWIPALVVLTLGIPLLIIKAISRARRKRRAYIDMLD